MNKKVKNLSAGEKERVAVAVTLARGCKLMLADEPGTHLDPHNLLKTISLIKHETDVALVTMHSPIGFPFCDRFYTLKDGILVPSSPEDALGLKFEVRDDCMKVCFS